jgi:hypothetical protein
VRPGVSRFARASALLLVAGASAWFAIAGSSDVLLHARLTAGQVPAVRVAASRAIAELIGAGGDDSPVAWDPDRGLWWSRDIKPHWWQSALALRTLVRYLERTDNVDSVYQRVILETYARNVMTPHAAATTNFVNRYLDDTAWWGLAWLEVARYELRFRHDLSHAGAFLRLSEWDAHAVGDAPRPCGGISWRLGSPPDTIANAEYAALAGELFTFRRAGVFASRTLAAHWLSDARSSLAWLRAKRLIDPRAGTVYDRLSTSCVQRIGWPMTYTEGEVAQALVTLGSAEHARSLLSEAHRFLSYTVSRASGLMRGGVLQERCEGVPDGCERVPNPLNLPAYKGIFVQAVSGWSAATGSTAFRGFIRAQARAVLATGDCSSPPGCQFGFSWAPPLGRGESTIGPSAASQASALDALTAALPMSAG